MPQPVHPHLPEPVLQTVHNETGLPHFLYDKMGPGKTFHDVLVVKASFHLGPDGVSRCPQPAPLNLADRHRDPQDPLGSSLGTAGDLILGKPGCDITFSGVARATRPYQRFVVGARLGPESRPLIDHQCVATGPRRWQHHLLKGWHTSAPEFTQQVPILYELSWGGRKPDPKRPRTQWDGDPANPAGSGYSFAGLSIADTPAAPQWEERGWLAREMRQHRFVGLGPVARHWASRKRYAGTYDAAWRAQYAALEQDKAPPILDYPADFDPRFFQCAHPQLQSAEYPWGDEALQLHGLFHECSTLDTALPDLALVAQWQQGQTRCLQRLKLDTIHIEMPVEQSSGEVQLVWRLTLPQHQGVHTVALQARSARALRQAS